MDDKVAELEARIEELEEELQQANDDNDELARRVESLTDAINGAVSDLEGSLLD